MTVEELAEQLRERVIQRFEMAPPEVKAAVNYVAEQVEKVYDATPFLQWLFEVALPKLLGS